MRFFFVLLHCIFQNIDAVDGILNFFFTKLIEKHIVVTMFNRIFWSQNFVSASAAWTIYRGLPTVVFHLATIRTVLLEHYIMTSTAQFFILPSLRVDVF